ncbi:hypothetical protein C8D83_101918 [Halothiobacillus neapolitanus]|nr:hypothetical protein C8D83_101918 [Halothiobacillus neapolitanus]
MAAGAEGKQLLRRVTFSRLEPVYLVLSTSTAVLFLMRGVGRGLIKSQRTRIKLAH